MTASRLEEFANGYVVVPTFSQSTYGMVIVNRGDMTDKEWAVWNKARTAIEIKQAMRTGKPSELPAMIIKILNEKGVPACLTGQARPIM